MTEKSWLWTGTATGDATLAPYEKTAFNRWYAASHSLNSADKFYILPGYLEDLLIEPLAGSSYSALKVHPGVLIFKNYLYTTDEPLYFNIDPLVSYPTTTYYRYDSLVLRLEPVAQKLTLALLVGTEATSWPPAAPTLTQTNDLYEVEVARVLIDSTTFVVDHKHVINFSLYLPTSPLYPLRPHNLFLNSEFMNMTDLVDRPSGWQWSGGGATLSFSAPFGPQKRGWAWTLTTATATTDSVFYYLPLQYTVSDGSNVMTYEGLFSLANDTVIVIAAFIFYDKDFNELVGQNIELMFHGAGVHRQRKTFLIPPGAKLAKFKIYTTGTTNTFSIGQQLATLGYFTGGFRSTHEAAFQHIVLTDTSRDR